MSLTQKNNENSRECEPCDTNEPKDDVENAYMQVYQDQEKQSALGKLREGQACEGEYETSKYDSFAIDAYIKARHKYIFFWKSEDIYSQLNTQRIFYVDGQKFNCAEQFMMYKKAVLFKDWKIAEDILWCKNPRKMKALGREIRGVDEKFWTKHCLYIVKEGNMKKVQCVVSALDNQFTQNEDFLADLLLTYPKLLVEASPYDTKLGIGWEEHEPEAWDVSKWRGENYLGYIITEVRDDIMVARGMIDEKDRERYIDRLLRGAGYEPIPKSVENTADCRPDKYLLFLKGIYSQWHRSWFKVDDINFSCAEQFMMYRKAFLFEDRHIGQRILTCNDPKQMKALGRKVKGFNEKIWGQHCLHIVKEGNLAKFKQNERLRKEIITTYPKILAEANPYDDIWGIGLAEDSPYARNENTWRGWNCLGFILTEVRDEILYESGLIKKDKVAKYIDKLQVDCGTNDDQDFQHDKKDKNNAGNKKYISGLHVETPVEHMKDSISTDNEKKDQKKKYIPGLHVDIPTENKKGSKSTSNEKNVREEKNIPGLHGERSVTNNKSVNQSGVRHENQRSVASEHKADKRSAKHDGQNATSNTENDELHQHDIDDEKTEMKKDQVETMSKTQRKKLEKAQRQSECQNNHVEDDYQGAPSLSRRQRRDMKKKEKENK